MVELAMRNVAPLGPTRLIALTLALVLLASVLEFREPGRSDAQVILPLVVTSTFTPSTVNLGVWSNLTITLTNPNTFRVDLINTVNALPAGLLPVDPDAHSSTCANVFFNQGFNVQPTIQIGAVSLAANTSCVITWGVTANSFGVYVFTAGPITIAGGPTTASVSATLQVTSTVPAIPELTLTFSPNVLVGSGESVLTYTIRNPNATALTNISFFDRKNDGDFSLREPIGGTCGGTRGFQLYWPGNPGDVPIRDDVYVLTGLALGPLESCTITLAVDITVRINGTLTKTTKPISSTESGTSAKGGSGQLQVFLLPPVVTKSFDKQTIQSGEIVRMTVTLTDPNPPITVPNCGCPRDFHSGLDTASVLDSLPAGLAVAPVPNREVGPVGHAMWDPACNGVVSATPGSVSLGFSGRFFIFVPFIRPEFATAAESSLFSCWFKVDLVSTGITGTLTNTTGVPTSPNSIAQQGIAASASVTVTGPAPTTISIVGDFPEPSFVGQPYTVQWQVVSSAGIPTGTVNVTVDGGPGCSAPVSAGQCNVISTTPGTKSLVASYSGDSNLAGSTSPAAPHLVITSGPGGAAQPGGGPGAAGPSNTGGPGAVPAP